ncbi:hypothetical protein ZIOFF_006338 [Zingiber officinale]|uniref:Orc1-like AAA ATPase domain-containing protein n=2 Tax=Zingiber officinale TaxID=94328 RepID=A0A8J5HPM6_ZINOF|nr:hypothetical protein ZIOFF_006338 [Zingiber officinale]
MILRTPTRRITRSSAVTPSKTSPSASKPLPPPSVPCPAVEPFSSGDRDPLSLDELISLLPGRKPQIHELLRLIGPSNSPMLPALLYGGPSTGKTATVLRVFQHLRRRFVYASCRSCYCPRILFETVLDQLLCHKRCRKDGYSSAKRCDKPPNFVDLLRDALIQATSAHTGAKMKSCSSGENGEMIYLIFDNVELIRSWDKGSLILQILFRIPDLLKVRNVGLIYISRALPDAYYSMVGSLEPLYIYFPDYSLDDIHSILMRNQVNPKLYSCFLSVVLKPFSRITRRIDELAIAFKPLFKKYCEALTDPTLIPDEATKRRLFDYLQPHLTISMNEIFNIPSWSSSEIDKERSVNQRGKLRNLSGAVASGELDIHMSLSAKYLLISAFLASRNPATLDGALFDSTGGSDNRKRKRKSLQTSIDKQDNLAAEILIKGPGTFPLERLLVIFQCITSTVEYEAEEVQLENGEPTEGSHAHLMSDVLLQLSTLCNANFICKSNSCPLEGSTRYRSMIDEDMAFKVARRVNFPLSKYIYRR